MLYPCFPILNHGDVMTTILVLLGVGIFCLRILGFVFELFTGNSQPSSIKTSSDEVKLSSKTPIVINESYDEIVEKNKEGLQKFLELITSDSSAYYVDNKTMEFLRIVFKNTQYEITHASYYSKWIAITAIPEVIKVYARYVHREIENRNHVHKKTKQELMVNSEKDKREKNMQLGQEIIQRNTDKVNKFLEIAYRKTVKLDEYGDENKKAFDEELERFFKKLMESEVNTMSPEEMVQSVNPSALSLYLSIFKKNKNINPKECSPDSFVGNIVTILTQKFQEYYLAEKNRISNLNNNDVAQMSGIQFEQYIIKLLKKCGILDVGGTSTTGDQGADILFTHNGKRVVIQAKRYSSNVGNGAIQEVHAAKGFYHCNTAWVITNSTFTKSAQELARKLNVILVDGNDLVRLESKIEEYLKRD